MNIALVGYGKMGREIEALIEQQPDLALCGVVDPDRYPTPRSVPGPVDVMMDFSYPGNLPGLLACARENHTPLVIGTTGYTPEQVSLIEQAAMSAPIVFSANYSMGVCVMRWVLSQLSHLVMDKFDVEIVETHHNQKADAPSGTAKMLLAALDPTGSYTPVYGRSGLSKRGEREIGVHAIRGGTVAGEHQVLFLGEDEVLEIRHSAASRRIFARGALYAARFAARQKPGLYTMEDVLWEEETP